MAVHGACSFLWRKNLYDSKTTRQVMIPDQVCTRLAPKILIVLETSEMETTQRSSKYSSTYKEYKNYRTNQGNTCDIPHCIHSTQRTRELKRRWVTPQKATYF
ncbi:hypothetical protein RUM43_008807 [Polyplax serrata]|uniref:Uncharacterized protein n=1 Tax=Polyplax serrata TaxID=468196 RepID=A0AAN8S437_POLSC